VTQLIMCAGSLATIMPALVKAWRNFEHVEQRIWDHYDMPEVRGNWRHSNLEGLLGGPARVRGW
jgi:hypothetical protein